MQQQNYLNYGGSEAGQQGPQPPAQAADYSKFAPMPTTQQYTHNAAYDAAFNTTHNTTHSPRPVIRFWKWEILSLLFAAGLIAAIFAILAHFDGQQVPQWPLQINLTTLVSLLATIFKAATISVVAEAISQAKWFWFGRPRRLMDLQRFDRASRGVIGSLQLFGRVSAVGPIAGIGALITIVSLAIGPFTQQSIKTVSCQYPTPGINASIPVANYLLGDFYRIGAGRWELDVDTKGAMINALTNPLGNDSALVPNCPTGNCTFPAVDGITHSTIGLCSRCFDSTAGLGPPVGVNNNYSLPIGLWIDSDFQVPTTLYIGSDRNFSWVASHIPSDMLEIFPSSFFNFTSLAWTNASCSDSPGLQNCPNGVSVGTFGSGMRPLAVSCSLYACLKNFNGYVSNGKFQETQVSTVATTLLGDPIHEAEQNYITAIPPDYSN